jgi:hypothetical protein
MDREWQQDSRYDDVPSELTDALDIVLSDLQRPKPVHLGFGYVPSSETLWITEAERPDEHIGYEVQGESGENLVVDLANYLQDQVLPESQGAWGEARPRCPGHAHPAEARLVKDEAWWICPADHRLLARIGQWQEEVG